MPPSLRTPVFHILLALAERDLHGLGIAAEIERATDGALEIGPGTLYRSLRDMEAGGLIQDTAPPEPDADPRRRYYTLTPAGRRVLSAEAARMDRIVQIARRRNVIPGQA